MCAAGRLGGAVAPYCRCYVCAELVDMHASGRSFAFPAVFVRCEYFLPLRSLTVMHLSIHSYLGSRC